MRERECVCVRERVSVFEREKEKVCVRERERKKDRVKNEERESVCEG